jgi:NTP pyrophosphatase (non-canonical NTP hydrolase)
METKQLTFAALRKANVTRCNRWHRNGIGEWDPAKWMTATLGELGEAANALKKLFRIEGDMMSINDADRQISSRDQAIAQIGSELADTQIYLDLLAARLDIDLEAEVIKKFNATSVKYNFPEQL